MSDKITELEEKIALVSRAESLAVAKSEAAKERRDAALKKLKDSFEVSSVEEAEKLLEKMELLYTEKIASAEKALEESL